MAKETNPRLLFERLFPNIQSSRKASDTVLKKSVLDFVLDDEGRATNLKLGSEIDMETPDLAELDL